eukprot:1690054-Heterocapsa_arctica.AAC.1
MTRQGYETRSCEYRTGAGQTKCGGKIQSGKLEFVPHENMSEASKTSMVDRKDIKKQVEDNVEICHRQKAKDWRQLMSDRSETKKSLSFTTGRKCFESCAISAQRIRHRAPAPRNVVTLRATRNGLDDGKWENA